MNSLSITDITNTAFSRSDAQWAKLQKLWAEIEKKQARNESYDQKISDFAHEFKHQVEKTEHAVCQATEHFILHLIKFIPRKTLRGRQYDALCEWINEEVQILESNPFRTTSTEHLRNDFNQARMARAPAIDPESELGQDELDAFRDELSTMTGEDILLSNDQLSDLLHDPAKLMDYLQALMEHRQNAADNEGREEETIDWTFEEEQFEQDFADQTKFSPSAQGLEFFNTREISKLYRQLAKQLHPDKEQNPEQKAYKKELMQQLSQAKKEKDTFAMLTLAQTWLPDFKLSLDKKTLLGLEASLRDKIAQLNHVYNQLHHGADLKCHIWRRFGKGNKAAREKAIRHYVNDLDHEISQLQATMLDLTTVKKMQEVLRDRVNTNSLFGLFPNDFIDFFD